MMSSCSPTLRMQPDHKNVMADHVSDQEVIDELMNKLLHFINSNLRMFDVMAVKITGTFTKEKGPEVTCSRDKQLMNGDFISITTSNENLRSRTFTFTYLRHSAGSDIRIRSVGQIHEIKECIEDLVTSLEKKKHRGEILKWNGLIEARLVGEYNLCAQTSWELVS